MISFLLGTTSLIDVPSLSSLQASLPSRFRSHPSLPRLVRQLQKQREQVRKQVEEDVAEWCGRAFTEAVETAPEPAARDWQGDEEEGEREQLDVEQVRDRLQREAQGVDAEIKMYEDRLAVLKARIASCVPPVPCRLQTTRPFETDRTHGRASNELLSIPTEDADGAVGTDTLRAEAAQLDAAVQVGPSLAPARVGLTRACA